MKYALIERPSSGTLNILRRKTMDERLQEIIDSGNAEALGICQGTVLEILVASDVAEKTAGVVATEVNGTCPNHMTCLAVTGDTSAVKAAMDGIRNCLDAQPK